LSLNCNCKLYIGIYVNANVRGTCTIQDALLLLLLELGT
jgi:hypothetical protein